MSNSKYILCILRDLTSEENASLSKHFKKLMSFDSDFHSSKVNLDQDWSNIDCLIVDLRNSDDVLFVETMLKDWQDRSYKLVVIKGSFVSGFSKLMESINPIAILPAIPNVDNDDNFFKLLVKTQLPKIKYGWKYFGGKLLNAFIQCIPLIASAKKTS